MQPRLVVGGILNGQDVKWHHDAVDGHQHHLPLCVHLPWRCSDGTAQTHRRINKQERWLLMRNTQLRGGCAKACDTPCCTVGTRLYLQLLRGRDLFNGSIRNDLGDAAACGLAAAAILGLALPQGLLVDPVQQVRLLLVLPLAASRAPCGVEHMSRHWDTVAVACSRNNRMQDPRLPGQDA